MLGAAHSAIGQWQLMVRPVKTEELFQACCRRSGASISQDRRAIGSISTVISATRAPYVKCAYSSCPRVIWATVSAPYAPQKLSVST